jgi:hypothetical protein
MPDPDEETAKANEQFVQQLLRSGWRQEEHMIIHPDDNDVNVFLNPYSKELLLSPKLISLLKEQADSERTS